MAAALRQMQQRHDTSLDEAVQLLVGQLWAAYFSIGSLQAHQQALQAQVAELGAGGGGGGAAGPAGGPGAPAAPGMQPEGDSQEEETISASLSFSEDDLEVREGWGCSCGGNLALGGRIRQPAGTGLAGGLGLWATLASERQLTA